MSFPMDFGSISSIPGGMQGGEKLGVTGCSVGRPL